MLLRQKKKKNYMHIYICSDVALLKLEFSVLPLSANVDSDIKSPNSIGYN